MQCRSVWSHPVLHSDASSPQSGPSLSFVSPALSAALEVVPQFYRRDILRSAMKQYGSTHTPVWESEREPVHGRSPQALYSDHCQGYLQGFHITPRFH